MISVIQKQNIICRRGVTNSFVKSLYNSALEFGKVFESRHAIG